MINYLIGAALVASTFFFRAIIPVDIRTGHQVFFMLSAFLIIAVSQARFKCNKENLCAIYFIFASFFLPENIYETYSFFQWLLTSLSVILYLKLKETVLDRKILYKFFAAICLFQCGWVFMDSMNVDIYKAALEPFMGEIKRVSSTGNTWEVQTGKVVTGSLGHPTLSGALIACLSPFVWKESKFMIALPLIALYLLSSTMSVISFICGGIYLFTYAFNHRKQLFLGMGAVLLGLFVYGNKFSGYFSDSHRVANWTGVLKKFGTKSIFFGNGPGFLEQQRFQVSKGSEVFLVEHNEILTAYFQYGLIGLAAIGFVFYKIMRKFKEEKDIFLKASLVALAFNCLGSFPLHIASTGLVFIILTSQLNREV